MTTMTIRCEEKDKIAAQQVAEYYGFDLSSVTRAFWKQMGARIASPWTLATRSPMTRVLRQFAKRRNSSQGVVQVARIPRAVNSWMLPMRPSHGEIENPVHEYLHT